MIFNAIIPDHNAHVFNPPKQTSLSLPDKFMSLLFGGLHRWDAVYFLHIAEHGYTYENCLAFFPLFPFVVRFIADTVLYPFTFIMSHFHVLLLAGVVVNLYCFVQASQVLYTLGQQVLKDEHLAYKAALLFCINPASIFMSAPYTEAMFAYVSYKAMLMLEQNKLVNASFRFGLSAVVRSNGLVACGFITYANLKTCLKKICSSNTEETKRKPYISHVLQSAGVFLIMTLVYGVISMLPFLFWQYHTYNLYCNIAINRTTVPDFLIKYGKQQKYRILGGKSSPWCKHTIPLSYSYIQSHHWDVGFLNYFQIKQIPNFLLAAPLILLCGSALWGYFRSRRRYCMRLGLCQEEKGDGKERLGYHGDRVFVYVAYTGFIFISSLFFIHIQVLTRLLFSCSPLLYWYSAWLTSDTTTTHPASQLESDPVPEEIPDVIQEPESRAKLDIRSSHEETSDCIQTHDLLSGTEDTAESQHHGDHTASCPQQIKQQNTDSENEHSTTLTPPDHYRRSENNPVTSDNISEKYGIFHNPVMLDIANFRHKSFLVKCIYFYFLGYCVVGTFMFSNFLPWT